MSGHSVDFFRVGSGTTVTGDSGVGMGPHRGSSVPVVRHDEKTVGKEPTSVVPGYPLNSSCRDRSNDRSDGCGGLGCFGS